MANDFPVRGFGVKFAEAIDYMKGKLPETSLAWDDLAGPVHGKVFTVAGATKVDLVRDLHRSISAAVENGTTITAFRKDFDKAVQEHGWEYRGKRGWRTSVIFDTNMRSAHMAGRWAQLEAGKDRRPFLQYRTAGDARVRPQHRAWNGLIYRVDDAFWQTHYPPNGWGCRCTVRAYSQADLDRKDLLESPAFENKTREVITRDGEIKDRVPVGIDPGWDHNVGKSWIAPELALGEKIARLPRELQGLVVDKTISPAFQTVLSDNFTAFRRRVEAAPSLSQTGTKGSAQIVGFLDSATLRALADEVPDLTLQSTAVASLDVKTEHLKGLGKRDTQQPWPADWITELPYHLRNYRAVLWDMNPANHALVVIPEAAFNDTLPKITLRPNIKSRQGRVVSVVSLGSASADNLLHQTVRVDGELVPRYKLLVGKIEEKGNKK